MGRLSKIKRELIQEANRRLLTEQDTGQGCTDYDCGWTSGLDRKKSIWPYEVMEEEGVGDVVTFVETFRHNNVNYWKKDEWSIFGDKTVDEAMNIVRESKSKQHACSLKITLTSMMAKRNTVKVIEPRTLLKYIDELCDIITSQSAGFGSKPEYVELQTIYGTKLIQK